MTKTQRWLTPCIPVCLLLLASSGCKEAPVEETPTVVRPIKMHTVAGAAGIERSFPGRVAAASQVDLSFRVRGPLIEFSVLEGQEIGRGDVLARIDPRDYRIRVESAQAGFDQARADFDRTAALYERDAVSRAQLDQTRAARDTAKATLDDAEADLGDTRLRAPFSGLIAETFVENFQDVRSGQRIVSLVAVDQVEIRVDLPESIVARIRLGRREGVRIRARFEAAPGREFDLQVVEMAAQADPRTQTYRGTLRMEQPEGVNILPGMTANVFGEDNTDVGTSIVIPAIAVVASGEGTAHVWLVDSSAMTVSRRTVTTGSLAGKDGIEIHGGLEPGDTIAISAVSRLQDGMQVKSLER
jgi:RND family efflux transporter MFP subunit